MKNYSILFVALLLHLTLWANDGAYFSEGSIFYPMEDTNISIEKEILHFDCSGDKATVNVHFQFLNPDNTPQTIYVGFVAPSIDGDVTGLDENTSQITDFTVMQNGKMLPYELKKAACEDCPLKEPNELDFSEGNYGVFVYLFEITFQTGLNTIQHSYKFPPSMMVYINEQYSYILTTGAKWAGNRIKDFQISFQMGNNAYFYVNDVFGPNAKWSVVGGGFVSSEHFNLLDIQQEASYKMVRTLGGTLVIEATNFTPTKNIDFGIFDRQSFICFPLHSNLMGNSQLHDISNLMVNEDDTKEVLRLKRNTIYAQYGYVFNSTDLNTYFRQFDWYIPNPMLTIDEVPLTIDEKKFIANLLELERKK